MESGKLMSITEFSKRLQKAKQDAWAVSPYARIDKVVMSELTMEQLRVSAKESGLTTIKSDPAIQAGYPKRNICGCDIITTTDEGVFEWIISLAKS